MGIYDLYGKQVLNQNVDYTKLPYVVVKRHSYKQFSEVLGIDITDEEACDLCNRYLIRDRRNLFVYEHVLNELSHAFSVLKTSPCESFVHLYRTLEFMSYSFPLIYASKSKKYLGSYNSLKEFFKGGDGMGELKFLGYFLDTLFTEEPTTYDFEYEVLFESISVDSLREDFKKAIKQDFFVFEGNTLTVKFRNIKDIFVEVRNKYFHMLLGQGTNNFLDMNYDKTELFKALNPVFINWISCIFVKIVQHGLSLYDE